MRRECDLCCRFADSIIKNKLKGLQLMCIAASENGAHSSIKPRHVDCLLCKLLLALEDAVELAATSPLPKISIKKYFKTKMMSAKVNSNKTEFLCRTNEEFQEQTNSTQ